MKPAPDNFGDLIEQWGIAQFADDLGINYSTANAMKQRKSVPVKHWPALLDKARLRGFRLGVAALMELKLKAPRQTKAREAA